MRKIIALLISLWALNLSAQEMFLPSGKGEIVHHTYYTLSYSEEHEQANWVYYSLTADFLNGNTGRTDNFREDGYVTTGSATLADYKGSGYDRGHLCPAGDMVYDRTSMSESFYLSNMSPQHPSFNRGTWKKLESVVRSWAVQEGEIHVVTGGVFRDNIGKIGSSGVTVPGYYYKVIYDPTNEQKMIALLLPNQKCPGNLAQYVVSVDYVENLTDINFFPQLPDELEEALESETAADKWDFTATYTSKQSTAKSTSVRCKGYAKTTGQQCKRMTTNENGYCWQHQDQVNKSGAVKQTTAKPKTVSGGRCQATTKAGTRCKRNAAAGSRYCWQHK